MCSELIQSGSSVTTESAKCNYYTLQCFSHCFSQYLILWDAHWWSGWCAVAVASYCGPPHVSEVLLFPEMCVNFKLVTASQSGSGWKEPQWVDLIPPACLSRVILEPTPQEWVQAVLEHLQ